MNRRVGLVILNSNVEPAVPPSAVVPDVVQPHTAPQRLIACDL